MAIDLARQLGIRDPGIERTIEADHNNYLIMERIDGTNLEESWTTIGWLATIRLAFQLRRYVQRLRTVTSSTAGSLSTESVNRSGSTTATISLRGQPPR